MLMGIDLGTTHIKVLVTDSDGRIQSRGRCGVSLHALPGGGVEQDIDEIWEATLTAIREALDHVDPKSVRAIGLSAQGGALQLFDERGKPRGRVISWLDGRGRRCDEALTRELGGDWFVERIGHNGSWLAVGQLERLRLEHPEWLRRPNRLGFVGDVIGERLTGRRVQDGTSAALTLLYSPRRGQYDPELLDRLGIESGQLPCLVSARDTGGALTGAVAQAMGMREGIPVSAGVHDQYASALASGAVAPGRVMVGGGTAWVLLAVSDRWPRPVTEHALTAPHVCEGLWGEIVSLVNGGSALRWVWELTGGSAAATGTLETLMAAVPVGSEGVRCWPFLASAAAAGLEGKVEGRFMGLQLEHRREHLARAVLEGLAFELNRHLDLLGAGGTPIESLVVTGGAARSRLTVQILADVTGRPLSRRLESDEAVLGAAILARGLLEEGVPLPDLAAAMIGSPEEIAPGSDRAVYRRLYEDYVESLRRGGRETK